MSAVAGEANPFEPWKPVVPPIFQGRKHEIDRLDAALSSRAGISIVGDTRIGKTSLLFTWQQKLEGSGREIRCLDGQGPEGETETAFVAKVIGRHVPEGADAAADALTAWVDAEPGKLAPVLLIDELDGLPARFDLRFFEHLRGLLGRVVIVFASRRSVDDLFRDLGRASPFGDRLDLLHLGLLDEAAATEVMLSGDELDADATALMRQWAGRHPLYLQLLGHALEESRRLGESWNAALDRFRSEAEHRLGELWRRLEEHDREALRAVAKGKTTRRKGLIQRGLVDTSGRAFGEVLVAWLQAQE